MTETVRDQILAIRDTGLTNMFDTNMVQHLPMIGTTMNWWFSSRSIGRNMCVSFCTERDRPSG